MTSLDAGTPVERIEEDEPASVYRHKTEQKLAVSMPMFNIGFKDNVPYEHIAKKEIIGKIAMDYLFGKSSAFFEKAYDAGLINDSYDLEYSCEQTYAHPIISGDSLQAERVLEEVLQTAEIARKDGIGDNDFARHIRLVKSSFIRGLNSVEFIARAWTEAHQKGYALYDYFTLCDTITPQDINDYIRAVYTEEQYVTSVILPK